MRSGLKRSLFLFAALILAATISPRPTLSAEGIPQISADELKTMIDDKKTDFLVVDVQPKAVYDLGHIKGAISFPWAADIKTPGRLPKNKLLVLYCDCGHEEDSTSTATQLKEKFGYANVRVLKGGWSGWMKQGYPVDKK